ncbi:MAG: hypothetical protein II080_06215 [Lachnospiraceae bacterium]|nr:hypothetical protein [Lachnospiraceae bacterium]
MGRLTYRGKEKAAYSYFVSLLSNRLLKYPAGDPAKRIISLLMILFSNIRVLIDGRDDDTLLRSFLLPLPQTGNLLRAVEETEENCPEGVFARDVIRAFLDPDIMTMEREEAMARVFDWIVKEEAYNNNIFMNEEAQKLSLLSEETGLMAVFKDPDGAEEYDRLLRAFDQAHRAICHDEKVLLVRKMKDVAMEYIQKKGGWDVVSDMVETARERLIFAEELVNFAMDFELDPGSSDYQIAMSTIIGKRDDYVKEEIIYKLLDYTEENSMDPVILSFLKHYFSKEELLQAITQYESGSLHGSALKAFYDVANYTSEQQIRQFGSRPMAYIV